MRSSAPLAPLYKQLLTGVSLIAAASLTLLVVNAAPTEQATSPKAAVSNEDVRRPGGEATSTNSQWVGELNAERSFEGLPGQGTGEKAAAQEPKYYPKAKVSYEDFQGLVEKVEAHRASRLVNLDTFLKMSREPGVIVLDSRSAFRYDRIHLKGAKHLAFTDFTQDSLARVIPSFDTKILIYCNNNFDGNERDFTSKIAAPVPVSNSPASKQIVAQTKPLMMALNIPTYINLYGYGYRNVYELDELVHVSDKRITFEGTEARR